MMRVILYRMATRRKVGEVICLGILAGNLQQYCEKFIPNYHQYQVRLPMQLDPTNRIEMQVLEILAQPNPQHSFQDA